jgi:hypothetical protein
MKRIVGSGTSKQVINLTKRSKRNTPRHRAITTSIPPVPRPDMSPHSLRLRRLSEYIGDLNPPLTMEPHLASPALIFSFLFFNQCLNSAICDEDKEPSPHKLQDWGEKGVVGYLTLVVCVLPFGVMN